MSKKLVLVFYIFIFTLVGSNVYSKQIKDPELIKANLEKNMKIVKPDGKGPYPTVILFTGAGDPFWREGYGNWMNW